MPPALLPPGNLWSRIVTYLRAFDPVQVRYAGQEWRQLVEIVAQAAQVVSKVYDHPLSQPFSSVIKKLTGFSPSWPCDRSEMPCCGWTRLVQSSLRHTYYLSVSVCVQGHTPTRCPSLTNMSATSLRRFPTRRPNFPCCRVQHTTQACLLSPRPPGFRPSWRIKTIYNTSFSVE